MSSAGPSSVPGASGSGETSKVKQVKAKKTKEQRAGLEAAFSKNKRPDVRQREKLAADLGLSVKSVTQWASNISSIPSFLC